MIRKKTRCSHLPIPIQHSNGSSSHSNQTRKRNKRNLNCKERNKKKDTLQSIIDKVNDRFSGNFTDGDRVIIEGIYQMFMTDDDVTKFKKYAKDNNPEMFVKSLFPDKFQAIVTKCYLENNDSFQKLFNDPEFYNKVMEEMAKELYKSLRKDEK